MLDGDLGAVVRISRHGYRVCAELVVALGVVVVVVVVEAGGCCCCCCETWL